MLTAFKRGLVGLEKEVSERSEALWKYTSHKRPNDPQNDLDQVNYVPIVNIN